MGFSEVSAGLPKLARLKKPLEAMMAESNEPAIPIMPYTMLVGQEKLKLAMEFAYIAPRLGGVLLSGQRGTGKSTVVRAFANMMYGKLPVTIPINATEDRVVGGWEINELLKAKLVPQPGLLEEADKQILYIDEVNLLDDHIVNIILDVTSTGILIVEREGRTDQKAVRFNLIGTMNPSEGGLRPQLLDRFGLMVDVATEPVEVRAKILQTVLDYDVAMTLAAAGKDGPALENLRLARQADERYKQRVDQAKAHFPKVSLPRDVAEGCVLVSQSIQAEGHRGDYVMALAAQANAALRGVDQVEIADLIEVAPLSLQHRRSDIFSTGGTLWTADDTEKVRALLTGNPGSTIDGTTLS